MALLPELMQTEDLELRRWAADMVDDMLGAIAVSFPELQLWMTWAQTMPSTTELRGALVDGVAGFDADREWQYAIYEKVSGELVGGAGLHRFDDPDCPEIGYWIRSDRTGRGYATGAARALADAAFTYLREVPRVKIRMDQANLASAAVPPKLGFELLEDQDREIVTKGHTGRGFVWTLPRPG